MSRKGNQSVFKACSYEPGPGGAPGRERPTVLRQRAGVDREDHEDVVLEERGHDGAVRELEAHGDALAGEAGAQPVSPLLYGFRSVLDDRGLAGVRPLQRLVRQRSRVTSQSEFVQEFLGHSGWS